MTSSTAAVGERGKTERAERGTDSSPHLGQERRFVGDRRRQAEKLSWGNFMQSDRDARVCSWGGKGWQ
jgi:hypothetical protein